MEQEPCSKNPALCAVWECGNPAVAASHCRIHQYLAKENEVDQDGPAPTSADQAPPPKRVKLTAKRTGALSIKRSTKVESQPARAPAASDKPASDTVSFEERNTWLCKFSKKAFKPGASKLDKAPSRSQPGSSLNSSEKATPSSNSKNVDLGIFENLKSQPSTPLNKRPPIIEKSVRGSVSNEKGGAIQDHDSAALMSRECQNPSLSGIADTPSSKSQPGLPPDQSPLPAISTAPQALEMKRSDEAEKPQVVQHMRDDSTVKKVSILEGCAPEEGLDVKGRPNNPNKRKLAALEDLDSTLQSNEILGEAQQGSPAEATPHLNSNRPSGALLISGGLQGLEKFKPTSRPPTKQVLPDKKETENRQASEPVVPLFRTPITLVRRATMSPAWQSPKSRAEDSSRAIVEVKPTFPKLNSGLRNAPRESSPLSFVRSSSNQPPREHVKEIDEDVSISIENGSTAQDVTSKPSKQSEERGRSKIAKFQSAAFDSMIYQQSTMTPPSSDTGVLPSIELPRLTPTDDSERLRLHVNPAIHRPHNRSEEWHRKKAQEIQARGGRKFWFGKTFKRLLWLRAKEKEKEKEILDALAQGRRLLLSDPQPWTYQRILDFGDVPEDDLPEEVLSNPSWLEYCRWLRSERCKEIDERRKAMDDRRIDRQRAVISAAQMISQKYSSLVKDAHKGKGPRKAA